MDDHRDSDDRSAPEEHHQGHEGHHHGHDEHGGTADGSGEQRVEQDILEDGAERADEGEAALHERYEHAGPEGEEHHPDAHDEHAGHGDHGGMHAGHETMFRRRFFISTLLSIPVLLYSGTLQEWLDFSVPAFPGSEWINPVFAVIVFAYGGVPFLRMAVPELRDRSPGMMTLISMAIRLGGDRGVRRRVRHVRRGTAGRSD